MSESAIEDLVKLAAAGDSAAADTLWRMHRRYAASVLIAHRPRGVDLEDLLQEVALRFVSGLATLRDPRRFRSWLRKIAVNVAHGFGRKRARSPVESATPDWLDERGGSSTVDRDIEAAEERARILAAIAELPPDRREPIVMRCLLGYSQQRIARELGVPETTVETRLARARRELRERLRTSSRPAEE